MIQDAPAALTDENLMIGWAKASLVVSFLGPSRQSQVEDGEFKGKLKWEPGYEKSFESIREHDSLTDPSHAGVQQRARIHARFHQRAVSRLGRRRNQDLSK